MWPESTLILKISCQQMLPTTESNHRANKSLQLWLHTKIEGHLEEHLYKEIACQVKRATSKNTHMCSCVHVCARAHTHTHTHTWFWRPKLTELIASIKMNGWEVSKKRYYPLGHIFLWKYHKCPYFLRSSMCTVDVLNCLWVIISPENCATKRDFHHPRKSVSTLCSTTPPHNGQ